MVLIIFNTLVEPFLIPLPEVVVYLINQKEQLAPRLKQLINRVRQLIETVNGQLTDQPNIEKNRACSFYGLCARLNTKLTAHTLCMYINRLWEKPNVLQIKPLAFPNI